MTEALYTHKAYHNVYGCYRQEMQTLRPRVGAEARERAVDLSEMQIPILEPGEAEGEKVMPAPKDLVKHKIWRQKLSEALKGANSPSFGKHPSEETKRKMSEARGLRAPPSEETRARMSVAHKGRRLSEETRRKIGEARRGKPIPEKTRLALIEANKTRMESPLIRRKISESLRGEKSPAWKGGISFEPYCQKFNNEFKERVRAFFGHHCVECGISQNGRKLHVHHVNFNKRACCDDTTPIFVALCPTCHAKTNNNRDYWEQHFTEMITSKYDGKCYFTKEEMTK